MAAKPLTTEEQQEMLETEAIKFVYATTDFTKLELEDIVEALREGGYKIVREEE